MRTIIRPRPDIKQAWTRALVAAPMLVGLFAAPVGAVDLAAVLDHQAARLKVLARRQAPPAPVRRPHQPHAAAVTDAR